MIQHRDAENIFDPMFGFQIAMFASNENGAKWSQWMLPTMPDVWIDLSNDTERCWNTEDRCHLMLFNDTEILTGIRCTIRFSFIHQAGAAVKQRSIGNVAMTDDPTQITCCEFQKKINWRSMSQNTFDHLPTKRHQDERHKVYSSCTSVSLNDHRSVFECPSVYQLFPMCTKCKEGH